MTPMIVPCVNRVRIPNLSNRENRNQYQGHYEENTFDASRQRRVVRRLGSEQPKFPMIAEFRGRENKFLQEKGSHHNKRCETGLRSSPSLKLILLTKFHPPHKTDSLAN